MSRLLTSYKKKIEKFLFPNLVAISQKHKLKDNAFLFHP